MTASTGLSDSQRAELIALLVLRTGFRETAFRGLTAAGV